MKEITDQYGLDLNGDWNKAQMPHIGRHPNEYHQWVLEQMQTISNTPGINQQLFIQQFNNQVINPVLQNPLMLNKIYWK